MKLFDMALKSGIAKSFRFTNHGVLRSDSRDFLTDDCIPMDATQISLIAKGSDWDMDTWFASKWDALLRTPMRPPFERTWIEWSNPAGARNATLCWWDEETESVWCQFATSSPCVSWIGSALMKPMDQWPYVCIIPYLAHDEIIRAAHEDSMFKAFAEDDHSMPWLPGGGIGHERSPVERMALVSLVFWGFIPITLLALKLPHVKNISLTEVAGGKSKSRRLAGKRRITWRKLVIAPSAASQRNGASNSQDLMAAHLVRGHIKTFTSDAPLFGKHVGEFWIPAHSRGNAKNGFVTKEYEIGAQE